MYPVLGDLNLYILSGNPIIIRPSTKPISNGNFGHTTVIAIAHRLSTIKHLDRIVVMEDGKIVKDGNFLDFLAIPDGKFKVLWEQQVISYLIKVYLVSNLY